jgi:hypothetical protein
MSACRASVIFTVAGKTFTCRPGEGWWFNHKRKHEVRNASGADRSAHDRGRCSAGLPGFERHLFPARVFAPPVAGDNAAARKALAGDCALQGCAAGPDVERYNAMDEAGAVAVLHGARLRRLIGYAIFICGPNCTTSRRRIANQDVLFLHPEAIGTARRRCASSTSARRLVA